MASDRPPLETFDFLYMPSRDVASDLAFYTAVLSARVVFAIEGMGARVAELKIVDQGPRLILADHSEGEAPTLVYRVGDLEAAITVLERHGVSPEARFEIPHGPCATVLSPGGQRLAIYELTRPEADD